MQRRKCSPDSTAVAWYRSSQIASLMVVYGALFAWLLLGETPAIRTAIGGILVLGAATAETLRRQSAA